MLMEASVRRGFIKSDYSFAFDDYFTMLIGAGIFQWTPLKETCLQHCRSPLAFLTLHWREGVSGAFRMGLHHGAYCVGCCWLLMALLFVLGVMNLVWIAVLTVMVLLEKFLPRGEWLSRGTGIVLVVWGITLATVPSS